MDKFTTLTGIAAPMPLVNIDTDMIIPKQFLKTIKRSGLGVNLFDEMRFDRAGNENPDFVLNKPQYRDTEILVAGENFGCGSSREHAPWAIKDFGIRCVISTSFADIFYNNCTRNGILPIRLEPEQVDELAGHAQPKTLTVDLPRQVVLSGNREFPFEIGGYAKRLLMEGLDPISLTKTELPKIEAFQSDDRAARPWIYR